MVLSPEIMRRTLITHERKLENISKLLKNFYFPLSLNAMFRVTEDRFLAFAKGETE